MASNNDEITEAAMKALAVGTSGIIGMNDPVAGAAIATGAEGITLALQAAGSAINNLRINRAKRLIKQAAENAGKSPEEFWSLICQSEKLLDLALVALEAGSKTALKSKIDLYAKILAGEIDSHEDMLDAVKIRFLTLALIEKPHLEILHVISKPSPNITPKDDADLGWANNDIAKALPSYEIVLPALIEPMLSNGLVWNNGLGRYGYKPYWKLTELGKDCLQLLSGEKPVHHEPSKPGTPQEPHQPHSIIQPLAKNDFNIVKLEIVDNNGRPISKPFRLKNGQNVFRCIATYADGSTEPYSPYWTCPIILNRGREVDIDVWGTFDQMKHAEAPITAGGNHMKYTSLSCWVFPPIKETPTGNSEIPHDGVEFDYSEIQ